MFCKKRLRNGLLTLAVVAIATALVHRRLDVSLTPGRARRQREGDDTAVRNDPSCTLTDNGTVLSDTGDYSSCVSGWLFTVDARTRSRTYPDASQLTEVYRATGVLPRCYTPPPMANTSGSGECFRVSETRLRRLGHPLTDFHVVNPDNVDQFAFVTGISDSHYTESLDAIASVQRFMPKHEVLIYNLGLTEEQLEEMATYCRVTVVEFKYKDRSLYPSHVQNLATFAFKPLIIMDALKTHPAIVWIDSSARLHKSLDRYYSKIISSGGVFLLTPPPKHSVVHHTHHSVYEYFPTNLDQLRHTMILMPDGYYSRTEPLYWHVLWWWTLCALTEDCISPCRLQPCSSFTSHNVMDYIGCHRYDMSVINLLLANYHGYDYSLYGNKREIKVFEKLRQNTTFYELKIC